MAKLLGHAAHANSSRSPRRFLLAVTALVVTPEQTKQGKGRVDIMHYHMSVFGQYDGTWNEAEDYYRRIMRDSERVNFVSVVREPRNHLLR